ncbi:MAG: single-stranded DNA-binding protein [Aquificota bacterium]|nr:MAG: single-stranded DNA-binding protein [Aquificota bacterium]
MLNKVIIIGRLVVDPIIRYMPSGAQLLEFRIVYNRRYMVDEQWREESHFFDVKAFGRLAEGLSNRISKGYTVVVEGRLVQDRWTDKEGKTQSRVRILAENVKILNKPKMEEPPEEVVLSEEAPIEENTEKPFTEDDNLPF